MKETKAQTFRRAALVVAMISLFSSWAFAGMAVASVSTTPVEIAPASYPNGFAQDAQGDIFISQSDGTNAILVIPAGTGSTQVFGQTMQGGTVNTLSIASSAISPQGLAFDASGNLFVVATVGSTLGVYVIAKQTQSIFGVTVPSNQLSLVAPVQGAMSLAFDSTGNLFVTTSGAAEVDVIPSQLNETLFGQSNLIQNGVNVLTAFSQSGWYADVAVEGSGSNENLFVTDPFGSGTVEVLPSSNGTLFGQSVTADVVASVNAFQNAEGEPFGLAFDAQGNLFEGDMGNGDVVVVAPTATQLFGQSIPANIGTSLTAAAGYANQGVFVDSSGDLFIGSNGGPNGEPAGTYELPFSAATPPATTPPTTAPRTAPTTTLHQASLAATGSDLFYPWWLIAALFVCGGTGILVGRRGKAQRVATRWSTISSGARQEHRTRRSVRNEIVRIDEWTS